MKRIVHHPAPAASGKRYWRSLDELADTPEFRGWLEREFPAGASELELDPVSRRNFIRLMGASLALAGFGFSGCRRPEAYLVPHAKSSEWIIPGKSLYYASAMPCPGGALPIIVTTHDGRPTKIEGNPLHPLSNGASTVSAQAAVLDLYDPDRSRFCAKNGKAIPLAEVTDAIGKLTAELSANQGAGLAIIAGQDGSPTRARLKAELLKKFPQALWCEYEPLDPGFRAAATAAAFGNGKDILVDFEKADVVVAISDDFLGLEPGHAGSVAASRGFASRRSVTPEEAAAGKMNRLYVAESRFTATGGMADHRLRLKPSQVEAFVGALGAAVAALTGDSKLAALCSPFKPDSFDAAWVNGCAADLVAHKGASVVTVGTRETTAAQTLCHAINAALGNLNTTIKGVKLTEAGPTVTIPQLAEALGKGAVTTLINLGVDLAFNAPADLKWNELQAKAATSIYLGDYFDDTAQASTWHLPKAHFLEAWGDARSEDGSYMIVQPMIMPLFGGWSELQLLTALLALPGTEGAETVRQTFDSLFPAASGDGAQQKWNLALRDGFVLNSAPEPEVLSFNATGVTPSPAEAEGIEVVLTADYKIYDGRRANNGWLQELPDPATKLTWDNAALISPATARELGVKDDDLVSIEANGAAVTLPTLILPSHADGCLSVALGYGREDEGRRVLHKCGFNAYPLMTTATPVVLTGVKVTKAGGSHKLAETQEHHVMEGRDHVRAATAERYSHEPEFAKGMGIDSHIPPNISIYHTPPLNAPHQWGMTIDLNLCSGCNACMIACQAENNIPIVGREQVIQGREMHWIRIDRYFASLEADEPNPEMVMQPLPCMHCENAPCETVCPVNATIHNEEGLNVMTYNRCIGTRYCANNCPYKVRRFNYFDYNKRQVHKVPVAGIEVTNLYLGPLGRQNDDKVTEMQKNPNVSVRMRGVIEKCSFCVQRLEEAKIAQKVKTKGTADVKLPTDSVKSACQQVCPTGAITFGDIADPESAVSKAKKDPRNYELLSYLNVKPRVTYLARLKNPNPAMPDAARVGDFNVGGKHHGTDAHGHSSEEGAKQEGHGHTEGAKESPTGASHESSATPAGAHH